MIATKEKRRKKNRSRIINWNLFRQQHVCSWLRVREDLFDHRVMCVCVLRYLNFNDQFKRTIDQRSLSCCLACCYYFYFSSWVRRPLSHWKCILFTFMRHVIEYTHTHTHSVECVVYRKSKVFFNVVFVIMVLFI